MEPAYHTVRLLKNRMYPTYQLYAEMANKKTPLRDGLRLGALTVIEWLRCRLREDTPPALTAIPGPDAWQDPSLLLPSLHIDAGFLVDMVSLPDEGIWTLQITEPDLGSDPGSRDQARNAVPGRVITTHIGFRITGTVLECGFCTVISDPEGTESMAEVYRLAVIRRLMYDERFGLRHLTVLDGTPRQLKSVDQLRELHGVWRDVSNQIPTLILTHYQETQAPKELPRLEDVLNAGGMRMPLLRQMDQIPDDIPFDRPNEGPLIQTMKMKPNNAAFPSYRRTTVVKTVSVTVTAAKERRAKPVLPYDAAWLAHGLEGFARVYVLEAAMLDRFNEEFHTSAAPGDVVILEPVLSDWAVRIRKYPPSQTKRDQLPAALKSDYQQYPRGRRMTFGRISFLSAAREDLLRRTREVREEAEKSEAGWAEKIEALRAQWAQELDGLRDENARLAEQVARQKAYAQQLEQDKETLRGQLADEEKKTERIRGERKELIAYISRCRTRPQEHSGIADWADRAFEGRLIMHKKARALLEAKEARTVSPELICDALDFLATDYWEQRYNGLSEDAVHRRCSEKYSRPFDVAPVGDMTIEHTPAEYKIKYFPGRNGKPVESPLNCHLRVGNDAEFLLRIYFLHDDDKKLIVIGSLPRHLRNFSDG